MRHKRRQETTSLTNFLVLVNWIDSSGAAKEGWRPIEDIATNSGVVHLESVGWVVNDDGESLTVLPHRHNEREQPHLVPNGCGHITIPRAVITKITILRKPR